MHWTGNQGEGTFRYVGKSDGYYSMLPVSVGIVPSLYGVSLVGGSCTQSTHHTLGGGVGAETGCVDVQGVMTPMQAGCEVSSCLGVTTRAKICVGCRQ